MISVRELTKTYGANKAVDNISFEIKKGEIVGLLGPNGAGKTTTMKIITGFMPPSAGDVLVGNISVTADSLRVRKKIGYLPENNPLYLDMLVSEYLVFAGRMHGMSYSQIKENLKKVLKECALEDRVNQSIGNLSKGLRQRVGLAQALISDPEILILDEPTVGLDPNQIVEIRELIKKIGAEKTVILSSHILAEVEATCDRVLIINKGKIVAEGNPDELRSRASGQSKLIVKVEKKMGRDLGLALNFPEIVAKHSIKSHEDGVDILELEIEKGKDLRKSIVNYLGQNGFQLLEISKQEMKLEDIFAQLTK